MVAGPASRIRWKEPFTLANITHLRCTPLAFLLCTVTGCFGSPGAALGPVASPNGDLIVTPTVNELKADRTKYLCIAFTVSDANGKQLHQVQSNASNTMKWAIGWHGTDTIILYSSDIGTSAWTLADDGAISELPHPLSSDIMSRGKVLKAAKYDG